MPEFPVSTHEKVLNSCADVPEMKPLFEIPLTSAGITAKKVWINVPQGRLPFDAEIMVSLPGSFRGIHMSRMERAISRLYPKEFNDIRQYGMELCREVLPGQRGETADISIKGAVPQLTRTAVSNEISVDGLDIWAVIKGRKDRDRLETTSLLGVAVTHMTACPCTKIYSQELFPEAEAALTPTHSQRCITSLEVEDRKEVLSYEDLYRCLASCLHVSQDLLKRPDEVELVIKSHRDPQFAEDAVRQTALSAAKELKGAIPEDSRIRIESVSLESIHQHNVKYVLECTMEQIVSAKV